jgi:hypothetical protein
MEDSSARIKITVGEATIEIEGSEAYVEKKLSDPGSFNLLTKQAANWAVPASSAHVKSENEEIKSKKPKESKKGKAATKGPESYSIVPDLDLKKTNSAKSLKEFYEEKQPNSFIESNAVFIYYLKKIKQLQQIGIKHVYTCYKEVGVKVPARLYQSLIDTCGVKGWIITEKMEDLNISTVGESFVELELPKSQKSK